MSIPPGERAGVSDRVQHQARAAQLRAAKSATSRNNSVVNGRFSALARLADIAGHEHAEGDAQGIDDAIVTCPAGFGWTAS
jgi:hypothetical protein